MHNHLRMEIFCPIGMLYNVLLLINCNLGDSTTTCHNGSMSNNRDLAETFHQKISHYKVIASAF